MIIIYINSTLILSITKKRESKESIKSRIRKDEINVELI